MKRGKVSIIRYYSEVEGGLESILRFGHYEMGDKCVGSSFSTVVGVDSRLW